MTTSPTLGATPITAAPTAVGRGAERRIARASASLGRREPREPASTLTFLDSATGRRPAHGKAETRPGLGPTA